MDSSCESQRVGGTCRLFGTVSDVTTGNKLGNRKVELWMSRSAQTTKWSLVTSKTTSSTALAQATVTLDKTRLYQWHYAAPRSHELPSDSARVELLVNR